MNGVMSLRYAANLSTLYTEVPFLERFARAASAGFAAVEFLFPYEAGVETIKTRVDDLGLTVALFNLHAGNLEAGEWGTLSNPAQRDYFRWSFRTAVEAATRLNCRCINTMFGNRIAQLEPNVQVDCAVENLLWAAPQAAQAGITLLVESLNPTDFPDCFLHTTAAAMGIVNQVKHPAVKLQYDLYHAQMTEGRLIDTATAYFSYIGHIQIADVPGRHEPGTGEINYPMVLAALQTLGYRGYVGLEYRSSGETNASLAWLPREDRGHE